MYSMFRLAFFGGVGRYAVREAVTVFCYVLTAFLVEAFKSFDFGYWTSGGTV